LDKVERSPANAIALKAKGNDPFIELKMPSEDARTSVEERVIGEVE